MKSKKKILFICDNLGGGGAERVAALLLEYLDRGKFEPYLLLFRDWHDYDLPEDVPVICLQKKSRFDFPRLVWQLHRVYKELKPDDVFCLGIYEFLIAKSAQKLSRTRAKMLMMQHFLPTEVFRDIRNPLSLFLARWLPRRFYRSADRVVCVSERVAQDTRAYYRLPEKKTEVIYNPIDINKIAALAREEVDHPWLTGQGVPVVISVGRLFISKGYAYLLKVFARITARVPACLVILGEGGDKEALTVLAAELGIADRVAFLGFQQNPFRYIKHSDCFVMPSPMEGSPMVIPEAMACGVPVVSTRCHSGLDEVIADGQDGLLVPPASEEALAEAVLRVLSDRQLAANLARAAGKKAQKFSVEKIVKEYEELFQ